MKKYIITGGVSLTGEVHIEGSKNSTLPILAASILNGDESIIDNCPIQKDVESMIFLLNEIGCKVKKEGSTLIINSQNLVSADITNKVASSFRASIVLLGPLLSKFKKVTITHPGGCVILL